MTATRRLITAAAALSGVALVEQVLAGRPRRRAKAAGPLEPPEAEVTWVTTDDGARLRVLQRGSGRPVVFIHGVLLGAEVWRFQLEPLSSEFRVVAYDQRGHGLSQPGTDRLDLPRLAADLVCVLEALELEDVLLVGHSMGGMAALKMADAHPEAFKERVGALMLVSTSAGPLTPLPPPAWRRMVRSAEPGVRRALEEAATRHYPLGRDDDLGYLGTRVSFGASPSPRLVEATRRIVADTHPVVLADLWDSMLNVDLRHACAAVGVPAMVVVGSRDVLTPPRMARGMASALPGSQMVVLPGCGHMPMFERPGPLADLVRTLADRR